jgi:hypothetical protein
MALKLKTISAANFKISKPKVCEMNGTSLDFEAAGIFGSYAAEEEWVKYRAIIDVDGNFATNGLAWRVLSGSVLFRVNSTNYGWMEDLLRPHVHFLPLKEDLSDIQEAVRLASSLDPAELVMMERIAQNAKQLSVRLSYDSVVHHFALALNRISSLHHELLRLE